MAKRINQGANQTLETWMTRGAPYIELTNSKGVKIAPAFVIAATESFELSQANTAVTLNSAAEENNDIVRRVNVSKELTGTFVCRDFKPEIIEILTGGTTFVDEEEAVTMPFTVKKLGEFILLDGFQNYDDFTIVRAAGGALVEGEHYSLSDGVVGILKDQPVTAPIALNDVLTLTYTRKKRIRIEGSTKNEVYGKITFIGHRVTEPENNLFKVVIHLAQIDTSTFVGQSVEDFASDTFTFTLLATQRGAGLSPYYHLEFADESDLIV